MSSKAGTVVTITPQGTFREVGPGDAGQVLTSNGPGLSPTFEDLSTDLSLPPDDGAVLISDGGTGVGGSSDFAFNADSHVLTLASIPEPVVTLETTGGGDGVFLDYYVAAHFADGSTTGDTYVEETDGPTTLDTDHYVDLSWDAVPGADGYIVFTDDREGTPNSVGLLAELDADTLTFRDDGVEGDGIVNYHVNTTGTVYGLAPGAPANAVQFNNNGSFGGSADFTWNLGLGTPGPLTATLVATGVGNIDAGDQTYKVTFVDAYGNQTLGGTVSNTVTTDGTHKQVDLSDIPLGPTGTVARQIYRQDESASDDTFWSLTGAPLWALNDNTTTIFTDNVNYNNTSDSAPEVDTTTALVLGQLTVTQINGPTTVAGVVPSGTQSESALSVLASNTDDMSNALISVDIRTTVEAGTTIAYPHAIHGVTTVRGTSTLAYGIGQTLDLSKATLTSESYVARLDLNADSTATFSGTGQVMTNLWLTQSLNNGPTATETAFIHVDRPGGDFSHVTNAYGIWLGSMDNIASNSYPLWIDSNGVFRIRTHNSFDSVYQSIAALYNPQFTKYTPGATNFERVVMGQWNGNIAEIGTEKGGSGTLRNLRLIASTIQFSADAIIENGKALKTDTTTAHTALFQAYDVDGTAYKTFATLTNGNTPDFTIAPPSGGTVTLQASTFKSSDGSSGATAGPFTTITSITVKNGIVTALTGS